MTITINIYEHISGVRGHFSNWSHNKNVPFFIISNSCKSSSVFQELNHFHIKLKY